MSEPVSMPEHDDVADLLLSLGALQPPAELHGYLAGQLAVGARLEHRDWLEQARELLDSQAPDPEQAVLFTDLYQATLEQMEEGQMALDLLLPDDDVDLDQRVESLGHWCQGFLAGFALAGKQRQRSEGEQNFSDDISEVLSDFAAISQIGLQDEDATAEEGESQFFSVCEYVRLAVLNVFIECNAPEAADNQSGSASDKPALH